ncbi:hypothetical protein ACPEEZ_01950 [Frigoribacterium sp. 2-23]|uniref:hypothetical protein n=1 Tax=Frigoribacterium sp. 2-23 TaxID=3415006 RepID=UPI003C6F4F93
MTDNLFLTIVIGLLVVGWLAYRQLQWTGIDRRSVWRSPIVLGGIGLVLLAQSSHGVAVGTVDIALIVVEAAVSLGLGLLMGRLTRFRTAARPDRKGRVIEARTGRAGAALWIALIAVRVLMGVVGASLGAHLLESTGVILLTIAVNRAALALVVDAKLPEEARVATR